ncbi:MAG: hypothetical protein V7717_11005 [Porticoccaceae bacterium]
MTEAEAIESLTGTGAMVATFAAMWISMTFGYLTVAYFIGAALSRFQCTVISVLYAVWAGMFASVTIGYGHAWLLLREREDTIYDSVPNFASVPYYLELMIFVFGASTLVTLYFMHDIRKRG